MARRKKNKKVHTRPRPGPVPLFAQYQRLQKRLQVMQQSNLKNQQSIWVMQMKLELLQHQVLMQSLEKLQQQLKGNPPTS